MNRLFEFIKTTILGGVVVLLPLAICAYLVGFVIQIIYKTTSPILKWCGIEADWAVATAPVAAAIVIIILCFLLGLILQTTVGRYLGGWIERLMLQHLPGYHFLKQISRQFVGKEGEALGKPVLVRIGDSRQIGLLVEELPNGQMTVFIPLAPAMSLGSIVIVAANQVELLAAPMSEALNAIGLLGYGSAKLLAHQT